MTRQNQKSQRLPSLEVMVRVTKMHLYSFEYPPLLGCSRDRFSLSNLRKIQVDKDRCPSFYSGKHFNSLVNAYETAGFSRVSKEQYDR